MENFFERLKKYYEETPKEVLEKEWEKILKQNNPGPEVCEYMDEVKKMSDIFKDAYFGKPYETRDGSKAVYIGDNTCLIEGCKTGLIYSYNGRLVDFQEHGIDIVSEWHEEINEEELDKLAYQSASPSLQMGIHSLKLYKDGFKAGYRKALGK